MATVRKRGNTYQIRVSAGYDVTGKQLEKSMTWKPSSGMTAKQIEKELERQKVLFEEKVMTGLFLDSNITLAQFSEKWFHDYAEKQLKARTVVCYRDLMPRILKAMGHIKLYRLQPQHLLEFYNNLTENGIREDIRYKATDKLIEAINKSKRTKADIAKRANIALSTLRLCLNGENVAQSTADKLTRALNRKGLFEAVNADGTLAENTIAKYHRLLSSMLTAAVQWQIIPSNPCQRVKPPRVEYKEAPVLDEAEALHLIQSLDTAPLKYRTAVMLSLYTGFRLGEVCGLDWSDIDLENGIVKVNKALSYTPQTGLIEDTPKTRKSNRLTQIPPDMVELLKQYKAEQARYKLIVGDLWKESGKAFTSEYGAVMRPDTLSAWFKSFVRKNNLPDIHFHTLRHTSATLLIANGVDIATVSNRLGHSSKSTTLNIYTHAIRSADEAAAETLQNIFKRSASV